MLDEPPHLGQVLVSLRRGVATVVLNRPERRNALSGPMLADLLTAFGWARATAAVRVVVLTGAGDRAFCAGADLDGLRELAGDHASHQARRAFVELFGLMQDLGKPILGRINGHALAGGLGLAASCDLLVAVDSATFGTPEINVGLWPAMIQAILARNLPRKALLEMMMLGERWSAAQLRELGLVNRVVGAGDLDRVVGELAGRLAERPPAVMRLGRDSFYRQQDMEFRAALEYLLGQLSLVLWSEDAKEGLRAFSEKRPPRFPGL